MREVVRELVVSPDRSLFVAPVLNVTRLRATRHDVRMQADAAMAALCCRALCRTDWVAIIASPSSRLKRRRSLGNFLRLPENLSQGSRKSEKKLHSGLQRLQELSGNLIQVSRNPNSLDVRQLSGNWIQGAGNPEVHLSNVICVSIT